MGNVVSVVVTDKKAIYVDGSRITHRGTKWGTHACVAEFSCEKSDVFSECMRRGYSDHAKNIDMPGYGKITP